MPTFRFAHLLKLIAVLASLGLAAGCGSGSPQADSSGAVGTAKGKTVAFVGYGKENPWGAYFNQIFIGRLTGQGVNVRDLTSMDPGTAVTNFNQAVAGKPDMIVTALLDTSAMVVPIKKAKQARIPVLVFDGRPDPANEADVLQVLSDNAALGTAAATNLVEGLQAQGKDSGAVFVITGTASGFVAQDRMQAFTQEMAKYPAYKVIDVQDGNWDPALTGKIATQLFAKYGCSGVQGAYGMADYTALAIIAAAKQAGCALGGKDGLIVTSSNCFKAGIEAIKAGTLYGTATEDPGTIAGQTADYVLRYFRGQNPPAKESVKEQRVTKANLALLESQCSNA
ncbi:sugar ABC transporter substrate-binding protein [Nocardia sp. NPDC050712]|uniref:sugar ABC transporter substrate-binding protein n=1 Tax=Nocardia sp. NPDC050712 TaxID=3155518 RepID=UPI0033EFE839